MFYTLIQPSFSKNNSPINMKNTFIIFVALLYILSTSSCNDNILENVIIIDKRTEHINKDGFLVPDLLINQTLNYSYNRIAIIGDLNKKQWIGIYDLDTKKRLYSYLEFEDKPSFIKYVNDKEIEETIDVEYSYNQYIHSYKEYTVVAVAIGNSSKYNTNLYFFKNKCLFKKLVLNRYDNISFGMHEGSETQFAINTSKEIGKIYDISSGTYEYDAQHIYYTSTGMFQMGIFNLQMLENDRALVLGYAPTKVNPRNGAVYWSTKSSDVLSILFPDGKPEIYSYNSNYIKKEDGKHYMKYSYKTEMNGETFIIEYTIDDETGLINKAK